MTTTYSSFLTFGFVLIVIPNLFMRRAKSPDKGLKGFFWPWGSQERYTPAGYGLFVAGWVFLAITVLVAGISYIQN